MLEMFKKLMKDETAPTAVEYGLMLAAIAAVVMGTAFTLGGSVNTEFDGVSDQIAGTASGGGN